MQITDTIHALRPGRGSNIYILKESQGLAVIDCGTNPCVARQVVHYIKSKMGHAPQDVKQILLTHWHGDHAGGAEELRRLTGARLVLSPLDLPLLTGEEEVDVFWGKRMPRQGLGSAGKMLCAVGYGLMGANTGVAYPDEVVQEGPWPFAPSWQVLALPGHTPGSLGLWSPQERILIAGDTVIAWGRRVMPPLPLLVYDPKKLYESWLKLQKLGRIEWLLCGHLSPVRWGKELSIPDRLAERARG